MANWSMYLQTGVSCQHSHVVRWFLIKIMHVNESYCKQSKNQYLFKYVFQQGSTINRMDIYEVFSQCSKRGSKLGNKT